MKQLGTVVPKTKTPKAVEKVAKSPSVKKSSPGRPLQAAKTPVSAKLAKATDSPVSVKQAKAAGSPAKLAKATGFLAKLAKAADSPAKLAKAAGSPAKQAKAAGSTAKLAKAAGSPSKLAKATGSPASAKAATPLGPPTPRGRPPKGTPSPLKSDKLSASKVVSPLARALGTPVAAASIATLKGSTPRGRPPKIPKTPDSIAKETKGFTPWGRPPKISKTPDSSAKEAKKTVTLDVSGSSGTGIAASTESVASLKTPSAATAVGKTLRFSTVKKWIRLGKNPKSGRTAVVRPLWSEVVRKNLGKTPNKGHRLPVSQMSKAIKKTKKVGLLGVNKSPRKSAALRLVLSSTGHAESPETIVIHRAEPRVQPTLLPKKGRKSGVPVS